MSKKILLKLLSYWPPLLGAGIRVDKMSKDFREIEVSLTLRSWNKNYVGTHFGGSLYSMTDPFYMLMLMENLGRDFIVWDQAANIRFLKPGTGKVTARFTLSEIQIQEIIQSLNSQSKVLPKFLVQIKNSEGVVVAEVEKTLYVRRKIPKAVNKAA